MLAGVLRNEQLNSDQEEVIRLLEAQSVRSVVLKGTSAARFYPYPDARCLGDIDLLVDQSNLMQVEQVLAFLGYKKTDHEHKFHISYIKGNTTIEVHFAASEVPDIAGGYAVQEEMKCFLNCAHKVTFNEMEFPVLSDSHQTLLMLLHMERHMLEQGIGLRQLCDWAVFVEKSDKSHWDSYSVDLIKKCGLLIYASVITKACVRYLGLTKEKSTWCLPVSDLLVDEFIRDVFRGGDMGKADAGDSSELFINRGTLGDAKQNVLKGMITTLSMLSYRNFPITKRCKMMLPFCWIYLPVRYVVRSLFGLRPRKNVLNSVGVSNRRYSLYKKLHLYEV